MKNTGASKQPQTQLDLPFLSRIGVQATELGLFFQDRITFDQWVQIGKSLHHVSTGVKWWVGDWLTWGEQQYGEMAFGGIPEYEVDELRKYIFVASRIPLARRRPSLSFTHHALVSGLKPDEQEHWLSQTEKHNLTTKELAASIKHGRIVTELELEAKTPQLPSLVDVSLAFKSPHWSQWKIQQWEKRDTINDDVKRAWLDVLSEPARMYAQLTEELGDHKGGNE